MNCKEVEYLLPAYIMDELIDDPKSVGQIEAHLLNCAKCDRAYEEYKSTIEFIREYRDLFAQAFEEVERKEAEQARIRKQKWARILTINPEKSWTPQVISHISSIAACLFICFVGWIILSYFSGSQIISKNPIFEHFTKADQPSVQIEDISDGDKELLASGREIVTSNQLKTLLINEKHRLIMDENTTLAIKPLVSNKLIGCVVTLSSGRIYTHVEHDGNPFIVETTHGKAIITGTTFDIEANESKMKLIVAEGSVKFASQAGSVNVSAGYSSEIFAKSTPTQPSLCDIKQLTAWATGYEIKTTITKIEAISDSFDVSDLWFTANSGPLDFENIDYGQWIEQKRDWFTKEFPLVFQLKEVLAQEDTETDYPELLFTSGDLWQFKYPHVSNNQFSVLTFDSLLRAASTYDFDKQWLLKNMPSIKSLGNNLRTDKGIFTDQEAFQTLIEQFEQARKSQNSIDSNLLIYSLHASTYLTNTRTLTWLYITNEQTNIASENKVNLLALLQKEVNEAEKIKEYIFRLFTISENCPCEEFNVLIDKVIDSLNKIMEIEKDMLTNQKYSERR